MLDMNMFYSDPLFVERVKYYLYSKDVTREELREAFGHMAEVYLYSLMAERVFQENLSEYVSEDIVEECSTQYDEDLEYVEDVCDTEPDYIERVDLLLHLNPFD